MRTLIYDFYHWWKVTLSSLAAVNRNNDPVEIISSTRIFSILKEYRDTEGQDVGHQLVKKQRMRTELVLDEGQFIERKLSPSVLTQTDTEKIVRLDFENSVPLKWKDVFLNIPTRIIHTDKGTRYQLVRRDKFLPIIEAADRVGIKVETVRFGDQDNADSIGVRAFTGGSVASAGGKILSALVMLLCIGGAATLLHAHVRNSSAEQMLLEQVDQLREQARQARGEIGERQDAIASLQTLSMFEQSYRQITEIWEELSLALPDSAYLTNFRIGENGLDAAGFARSAASLLEILESSEMFEGAKFTGPVVKVSGNTGHRFALNLKISNVAN